MFKRVEDDYPSRCRQIGFEATQQPCAVGILVFDILRIQYSDHAAIDSSVVADKRGEGIDKSAGGIGYVIKRDIPVGTDALLRQPFATGFILTGKGLLQSSGILNGVFVRGVEYNENVLRRVLRFMFLHLEETLQQPRGIIAGLPHEQSFVGLLKKSLPMIQQLNQASFYGIECHLVLTISR